MLWITIELLLNFDGSEMYLSNDPKDKGMVEKVSGYEKIKRLAPASEDLNFRVPLASASLARCLYAQGLLVAAIARRLRRIDGTIRRYLAGQNDKRVSGTLIRSRMSYATVRRLKHIY